MAVKKGGLRSAIAASKSNAPKPKGTRSTMPLSAILDRPHGDTRPLNPAHISELAESIAAVGLIQPIAVDSQGHLLAGGHRRAALELLEQEQPARYAELFSQGVPVRVFEFDAAEDADQAIAIEAAENEKRRDYTPAEVRELADRLVQAGYSNSSGRPKKEQKALVPALMTIVGKSRRTVQRYLEPGEKSAPDDTLSKWPKRAAQIEKWAEDPEVKAIARVLRNAAKCLRELEPD